MSSREERPRSWATDPAGATSASGGHLPAGTGEPLFDPLTAPLPSETAAAEEPYAGDSRWAVEERVPRPPVRRRRGVPRRVRRTIKHVDPLSVLKLSIFYYSVLLLVWLGVVAVLYWFIASLGVFDLVEQVGEGFAVRSWQNLDISLGLVEKWAFFIGLVFVVVASLINLFLAILYNIGADILGGIEVTFVERDH